MISRRLLAALSTVALLGAAAPSFAQEAPATAPAAPSAPTAEAPTTPEAAPAPSGAAETGKEEGTKRRARSTTARSTIMVTRRPRRLLKAMLQGPILLLSNLEAMRA